MSCDFAHRYRAVQAQDARFDGWFFAAVTSTGIYCRPSCSARTPKAENVRFYFTAAAAQGAGFRACKRCRPDSAPGSPAWDARQDLVGRAMRLIADGVVDREGVSGLARKVGFTERHLHRQLVAVVGAGPLALARAQRAQTARLLLEATVLPASEVAFAAGFQSVRQFNATVQEIFASTPGELRRRAPCDAAPSGGPVALRLPYRAPLDAAALIAFLGLRAVPGIEEIRDGAYRRSMRLPKGAGVVELRPGDGHVNATFWLDDLRDLGAAVQRCRRLLDLDSDPQAVVDALGSDETIGLLVRAAPGRRVAGHVDGAELAVRAVLGQRISLAAATTLASRLVIAFGEPLTRPLGEVTHLFPSPASLSETDPLDLAMPRARRRALVALVRALASGDVSLDEGADLETAQARLVELPGITTSTVAYVAMRALRDPDAFSPADVGVRHALQRLGYDGRPESALRLAEGWRPYRSYATQHLWALLAPARAADEPGQLAA